MRQGVFLVPLVVLLSACGSTSLLDSKSTASAAEPATPAGIISSLDGGLLGRAGLADISRADRKRALEAEYRALEYTPAGQIVSWNGNALMGEVVAAQPYRVGSQDCRPYSHTINDGETRRTVRGTACRNADGSWTPLT